MRVAFRTDSSVQIGTGHVMRCLTLAEELRSQGHECLFICRDHDGDLGDLIVQKGFALHRLTKPDHTDELAEDEPGPAHAGWLGLSWQIDAAQTLAAIGQHKTDWLVVDHYALDAQWERTIAEAVGQIMVVDDLADRDHECALLLDQNVLSSQAHQQYQARVNKGCKLLLGPQFALLRPEYELLADALPERDGNISRVLVFVGGSDPHNLTERYLEALNLREFDHLSVDVVIGKNHPSPEVVKRQVTKRSKTQLYSGLPSLAALMVRADLMLGAGGATNWERMCLGLNSIVASVAQNQKDINQTLGIQKLINFAGDAAQLEINQIREAIQLVLDSPEYNQQQSNAMRHIVDGRGTKHVIQSLKDICSHATT